MTMPTSRFHPKWRLGTAAYRLMRPGGCRVRYSFVRWVTVSTMSRTPSRGGATGTSTKMSNPMAPETNIALRSR